MKNSSSSQCVRSLSSDIRSLHPCVSRYFACIWKKFLISSSCRILRWSLLTISGAPLRSLKSDVNIIFSSFSLLTFSSGSLYSRRSKTMIYIEQYCAESQIALTWENSTEIWSILFSLSSGRWICSSSSLAIFSLYFSRKVLYLSYRRLADVFWMILENPEGSRSKSNRVSKDTQGGHAEPGTFP